YAFDFDGAGDHVEHATLLFHTLRFASGVDRDRNTQLAGQVDAFEIDVEECIFDGIVLLVGNDHRSAFNAGDFDVKNRVVAGLATDDFQDVFGVDADGLRVFERSVDDGRDHSG